MTSRNSSVGRYGLPLAVLAGLLISGAWLGVAADPVGPTPIDKQITKMVSYYVQEQHLSKHKLDDEISKRFFEMFLKTLDPMKVYFLQSDVDKFEEQQLSLDDRIKEGDIQFAYDVFETFLERIDQRVTWAEEYVDVKHDFTIDEEIVRDPEEAKYAVNEAEAREQWRKRIKFDLLRLRVDEEKMAEEKQKEKVRRRYVSFAKRMHQTDRDELLEMYLTALTMSFDPHTSYLSPSSYENFRIQMSLELDGIGAELRSIDGYTVVNKIIPEGAADKEGNLKAEDRIIGVGQDVSGEIEDVVDMKLGDVVDKIRGKAGTVVRLEVTDTDGLNRRVVSITRDKIELKDSEAQQAVFEHGTKPSGKPFLIGVIDLPSFYMDMDGARAGNENYRSTTRDVRRILEDFNKRGVDAVILDLRRNGGGSLPEAISTTGLFIESGPVVQVKDKGPGDQATERVQPYDDEDSSIVWKGPLIVMTSKFSASASEILAGAIQDYGRGLIVGDHATHGKGTVQTLMDLGAVVFQGMRNPPAYGALKITVQQFYRPSGQSTQNRGVVADVELPSLTTHYDVGESDLDYSVAFDQVAPAPHKNYGQANDAVLQQLRLLSSKRWEQSTDFQRVQRNIKLYLEQKDRKTITLNEEKFRAELKELDADKEEQDALEDVVGSKETGVQREMYLDEGIAIAVDYLNLALLAQTR
ncbi:MAG: carboxy terminal-processing peptidase [Thermoguttaceae bacterium]